MFFLCPKFIGAQEKQMGELTIENAIPGNSGQFVNLNGERVLSGRSITSPAKIETPAQTSAKISLARTGIIKIAPDSKMNLYFENWSISGDFLLGSITVDSLPFTKFNILTADGAITASNINSENVFVVNLVNKKTQLKVLSGEVLFNGILLVAGQSYPNEPLASNAPDKTVSSGSGANNNLIFIALGAAGAVALIAALALSGGSDNNNSTVSPIR